jgi:hypothetical protein
VVKRFKISIGSWRGGLLGAIVVVLLGDDGVGE